MQLCDIVTVYRTKQSTQNDIVYPLALRYRPPCNRSRLCINLNDWI